MRSTGADVRLTGLPIECVAAPLNFQTGIETWYSVMRSEDFTTYDSYKRRHNSNRLDVPCRRVHASLGAWVHSVIVPPRRVRRTRTHRKRDGHPGSPHRTTVAVAKRVRGAVDWIDATRVSRSCDRRDRSRTAPHLAGVCRVRSSIADASGVGQGLAMAPASRRHQHSARSWPLQSPAASTIAMTAAPHNRAP